jgi:hypothetical protein
VPKNDRDLSVNSLSPVYIAQGTQFQNFRIVILLGNKKCPIANGLLCKGRPRKMYLVSEDGIHGSWMGEKKWRCQWCESLRAFYSWMYELVLILFVVTPFNCCALLELGNGMETGSATKHVTRASGSSTASGAQAGHPRICDRDLQIWVGIGGWPEDYSRQKNS